VKKTFWDSNVFIYFIEDEGAAHLGAVESFRATQREGQRLVTSSFSLGELLAHPLRIGRADLVSRYSALIRNSDELEVVDFGIEAARHYATIRASTSVRQPDAIQLACAVASGARTFITNDRKLWSLRVEGIDSIRGI